MNHVLVDTSVLLKWFHADGEDEVAEARAIRDAHRSERLQAHILDLATYELGNVLVRSLRWKARLAADQLDDLSRIVGPALVLDDVERRGAARLAERHGLSFHDAAWAAAARAVGTPLVSADRRLLDAELAVSATDLVRRWKLRLG